MKTKKIMAIALTIALALVMILTVSMTAGCGASVESITLNTNGVTTTFEVGDEFSSAGLKVTANMSDGEKQEIALKDCTISAPNMSVAGEKEVTVIYSEVSAKYRITIKEPKPPMEWEEGFNINPDGEKKVFELSSLGAVLDGSDRLAPSDVDPENSIGGMIYGDKIVFMVASEAAGRAKLIFDFDHSAHGGSPVKNLIKTTVNNKELTTDAVFNAGEEGHEHANWMCYQQTLLGEVDIVKGQNTITIEFLANGSNLKGLILDFSQGGEEPAPDPVLTGITAATTVTDFYLHDKFMPLGVTVSAVYDDESTKSVNIADCTLSAVDMTTAGEKTVTVTYMEKTATYTINVAAERRFTAKPTEENTKFTFDAMWAELDDTVNIDVADNSIGGIAAANAPSVTFNFDSTTAGTATLIFTCDDNVKGTSVGNAMTITVNDDVRATDANFVVPPEGHTHIAWHCYHDTILYTIAVKEGANTITFDFKVDFTNIRSIALDFASN